MWRSWTASVEHFQRIDRPQRPITEFVPEQESAGGISDLVGGAAAVRRAGERAAKPGVVTGAAAAKDTGLTVAALVPACY